MRTLFTRSAETERLLQIFRDLRYEEIVTYADATRQAKFEVTPQSARYARLQLRKVGIFIHIVPKIGFRRGVGSDMLDAGLSAAGSMRRKGRQTDELMQMALRENLSRDEHLLASELLTRSRVVVATMSGLRPLSNRPLINPGTPAEPFDTSAALKNAPRTSRGAK